MFRYAHLGSATVGPNGAVFEWLDLLTLKIDFDDLANLLTFHE